MAQWGEGDGDAARSFVRPVESTAVRDPHSWIVSWEIADVPRHEYQAEVLSGCPDDGVGKSDSLASSDFDGSFSNTFVDRINLESVQKFADLCFLVSFGSADKNFHPGDEADVDDLERVELPPSLGRAAQVVDENVGIEYRIHLFHSSRSASS